MYETQKWDQILRCKVELHLFIVCTEVWSYITFYWIYWITQSASSNHPSNKDTFPFSRDDFVYLCIIWDLNINSWWLWVPLLCFHQWPHSHYTLLRQIATFIQGHGHSRCFSRNEIVLTDAFNPLFTHINLSSLWPGQNK